MNLSQIKEDFGLTGAEALRRGMITKSHTWERRHRRDKWGNKHPYELKISGYEATNGPTDLYKTMYEAVAQYRNNVAAERERELNKPLAEKQADIIWESLTTAERRIARREQWGDYESLNDYLLKTFPERI